MVLMSRSLAETLAGRHGVVSRHVRGTLCCRLCGRSAGHDHRPRSRSTVAVPPRVPTDLPIALVTHDRTPISNGVILRRTNLLDDSDIVEREDGIRLASPPSAWFDCARDLDDERFERLTEWVLDQHTTMPTLWRLAMRMSSRGRPAWPGSSG